MKSILLGVWRIAKWFLAAAISLVLLIIGCWLFWPDEALEPETQRLMNAKSTVPTPDNMYFALLGFGASPDLDQHDVGVKIDGAFAAWRKMNVQQKPKAPELFDVRTFYGKEPIKLPDKYAAPCRPEAKECLAAIRSAQSTLEERIARYAHYLAQCRSRNGAVCCSSAIC
jgi:hypothetical protein